MSASLVVKDDEHEYVVTDVVLLAGRILIYTAEALYVPYPNTGALQKTGYFLKNGALILPREEGTENGGVSISRPGHLPDSKTRVSRG